MEIIADILIKGEDMSGEVNKGKRIESLQALRCLAFTAIFISHVNPDMGAWGGGERSCIFCTFGICDAVFK